MIEIWLSKKEYVPGTSQDLPGWRGLISDPTLTGGEAGPVSREGIGLQKTRRKSVFLVAMPFVPSSILVTI